MKYINLRTVGRKGRTKNIDDLYMCAESVFLEFINSESNFYDICNLRNSIYEDISEGKIGFYDLSRSGEIYIHLVNVAVLSGLIAMNINLDKEIVRASILGGLLHDIGKFYIPERIINKPGKLSAFEYIAISSHETIGREIVSIFCKSEKISDIVACHHTYIKNLKEPVCISSMSKENKLLLPLICSIADITDAVVSVRPYKKMLSTSVARNDLHIKGVLDIDNIYKRIGINID